MIGVPPICQSAAGNGGESNGAGGIRRRSGEGYKAGGWYAGDAKSFANASINFGPNQSGLSPASAFEIANTATNATVAGLNDFCSSEANRYPYSLALLISRDLHAQHESKIWQGRAADFR